MVNGISKNTIELNSVLESHEKKHLFEAIFWNGKKNGQYPFYGDAAIILFASIQKTKWKRNVWNSAKKLYNNISPPPILIIDNSVINAQFSKSTFLHNKAKRHFEYRQH